MMSSMTQDMWTKKRMHLAAGFLAVSGLIAAGWFGYSWYMRSKEQAAYKDLAESIEGYSKARSSGAPEKWSDVERGFEAGAKRNTSSSLQPYFLVFQADALVEQGKHKEAAALMDKTVSMLKRTQPLYFLYALKRALIKTDIADETIQKQGRQELAALTQESTNPLKDMARYYAGLDALHQGDRAAAEKFLGEIPAVSPVDQKPSVWYQMAQEALSAA